MAEKKEDEIKALQLNFDNTGVKLFENPGKLAEIDIPEDDEGKVEMIRQNKQNAEMGYMLTCWFNGRVAYNYVNPDDEDTEPDVVDSYIKQLANELNLSDSAVFNYYSLYKRCEVTRLHKMAKAGVSWNIVRRYVLERRQDVGDKMFDFIEEKIDENDGTCPQSLEKDYLKEKLNKLEGKDQSQEKTPEKSQDAGEEEPAEEDQRLEAAEALANKMQKTAEGLESFAGGFFGSGQNQEGFREFVEQLYTADLDEKQKQKRSEALTRVIEQINRAMAIMTDLDIDAAMYSMEKKQQVADGASHLIERFHRDQIAPVVYEDNTVAIEVENEEEEDEEDEETESSSDSEDKE